MRSIICGTELTTADGGWKCQKHMEKFKPWFQEKEEEPHRCPVCDGSGLLNKPGWVTWDQETWASTGVRTYQCNTCKGTGLVWK